MRRAAYAAFALIAAYGARLAAGYGPVSDYPTAAVVLWTASMGLAALAFWTPKRGSAAVGEHRWTRLDTAIAIGIFAIALALRTCALAERPMLGGDEAGWGVVARAILASGGNPFGYGYYDLPALGEYATVISLWLGGPTIEALRLPSAIAGAATAVLAFMYGARLAGRLAGTAAGLVAATMLVHVHLSRQGINNVFDALTALIALAALERGWVERRTGAFLVAGVVLAVSQHFYASARLLPMIVVAWIAMRFVVEGRRAAERWRELAAMVFVALAGAWPQATLAAVDPARWLAPIVRQAVPGSGAAGYADPWSFAVAMGPRLRDAVLGFGVLGLRGPFVPSVPLLGPIAAVAFAAGLAALARRWREPFSQLAALWIGGVVAISALSESTPAGHRYMIAVPVVAIVSGIGAAVLAGLSRQLAPRAARAIAAIAVAALAIEGAWQAHRYFDRLPPWTGAARDLNGEIALDFAARIGAAPAGARAVMLGAPRMWYRGFNQLAFLRPGTAARDVEAGEAAGPAVAAGCDVASNIAREPGEPVADCLIAVLPHRERELAAIRAAVVVVHETDVRAADGEPLYRLIGACRPCGAPSAAPPAAGGATAPAVSSAR